MKRLMFPTLAACALLLGAVSRASAHCEMPCGIYDDGMRFQMMLESQTTIAKAMAQINDLAPKSGAENMNQLVRWVNTKEMHATKIMDTISEYFMAQRIKPGSDAYVKQLTAAHAVMQTAMKCKQTVDPKNADALLDTIRKFYEAYEGKPYGG